MNASSLCVISTSQDRVEIAVPGKQRLLPKSLPDRTVSFEWREVTRVLAFKRDQLIVDCICCIFELNGTETVEVNEDMQCWKVLMDAIPVNLSGALRQEEWWRKVAFPAFASC